MSKEEILQRIIDAILAGDTPAVEAATQEGLDHGIDPQALIDDGGTKGLEIVRKIPKILLGNPDRAEQIIATIGG